MAIPWNLGTLVWFLFLRQDADVRERASGKPRGGSDERAERVLAERFVNDGEAGFQEGIERYLPILRARVVRAMPGHLGRKVSVADVLQEVRIVAHRRRGGFEYRGPGSLTAWLLAIADLKVREAIRHHAGTAKRDVGREVDGLSGRGIPTADPTPSQQAIARETAELMRRAREQLSPTQQEVLRLVQEKGLTLGEVADRTGRSREAVKKIYGRGIVRFKELFDRGGEESR